MAFTDRTSGGTGKVVHLAAEPVSFFSRLLDPHASKTRVFSETSLDSERVETSHAAAEALYIHATESRNLLERGPQSLKIA